MEYTKIKYPDGQLSVKITDYTAPYLIKERINSYEDLFFIKAIVEALHARNIKNIHLSIPCLFGQRSDRRFSENQSFDLKIIAEFINSCEFMDVGILDPHSEVALALIDRSYKLSIDSYIELILNVESPNNEIVTLISPDAGAYKKVFELGKRFDLPVAAAVKHRDFNGEIDLKFTSPIFNTALIVDDLCDGGKTFIVLAQKIKEMGIQRIALYVTHGYFSRGFGELFQNIDYIYCTNSVKDVTHEKVTQFRVI